MEERAKLCLYWQSFFYSENDSDSHYFTCLSLPWGCDINRNNPICRTTQGGQASKTSVAIDI